MCFNVSLEKAMLIDHDTMAQSEMLFDASSQRLSQFFNGGDHQNRLMKGNISSLTAPIRGQEFLIPSLNDILCDWARRTNDGYQKLKPVMLDIFSRYE